MTQSELHQTLEAIYSSLQNDNDGLDEHIAALKEIMHAQNVPSAEIDTSRIPQPNRQGRKLMQSYFKQRGVAIHFADTQKASA